MRNIGGMDWHYELNPIKFFLLIIILFHYSHFHWSVFPIKLNVSSNQVLVYNCDAKI